MWGWIILIIVGGLLGWLASKIMRTDAEQGILLNIVVGIVGALLAGWIFDVSLTDPSGSFIWDLLLSLLGAIILLAIVNLFSRGRVR